MTGCYLFIATFSSLVDAVSSQDVENAFSLFYSNQIQGMTPEEEKKVTAGMVFHPPLYVALAISNLPFSPFPVTKGQRIRFSSRTTN